MHNTQKTNMMNNLSLYKKTLFGLLVFVFITLIFFLFPVDPMDWHFTFSQVAKTPLQPYSIKTFINPPWTVFILYPFHYFPMKVSAAINAGISFIVIVLLVFKKKGDLLSLALTLTSLPFFLLLLNGSIEWIPALGFILQSGWALPMLMVKPQSGMLAALAWFLNSKKKFLFITPAVGVIVLSFFVWGNWIVELLANIQYMDNEKIGLYTVNFSLFPWSIPIGLGLIFYILKKNPNNGELLGTLATYCLVPYFYPHSLIIPFALISTSHRRFSIILWLLLWLYPILKGWVEISHALGFG